MSEHRPESESLAGAGQIVAGQNHKRYLKWLIRIVVLALLVWFVQGTIRTAVGQLSEAPIEFAWPHAAFWLVAAGLFYLLGLLPSAIFWHALIRRMGGSPSFRETVRAYFIGHLGKYVPGKAMVVVLRVGMLPKLKCKRSITVLSVFIETLTMMAVGAFLSAGILILLFPDKTLLIGIAVGLMVAAGLPTLPPVFRLAIGVLYKNSSDSDVAAALQRVNFPILATGWIGIACGWMLMGLSLWATLRAMGVEEFAIPQDLPVLTASVALAMVAGFLSLIPGGAFVRELILTEILASQFTQDGEALALVSAVLLRLVWIVSESIISAIMYSWGLRRSSGLQSKE